MEKTTEKKDWRSFIRDFLSTLKQADVTIYSIVVTYYMLLSFFPLLIVIGNILPYLKIDETQIYPYIRELLPPDIYRILKDTIEDLLTKSNGGLLSISALGTFWAISKGINGIRISLDKAYGISKQKTQVIRRLLSFFMVFLLMLALLVLMFIMGFGQVILEHLLPIVGMPEDILSTFQTLRWPVTISVLFVVMTCIYYFLPSAKIHFKTILFGAVFTTLTWMLVTQLFSLYVTHFSGKISSYGIIGGFILFMFWLNIASSIIIIGGVINVTVEKFLYGPINPKESFVSHYVETRMKQVKAKRKEKKKE
ncbi:MULTISPECIES: YihY/virulence factor BrkB family protein [Vagococcus]|uniref:YihY/virulence factor BrkB family protein n=1 Tax=Vagococcus TaxID=2737 RepID=UPI000E4794FA|nr:MULTISPECIES: YihY/virulence factor BrkB family protein [Vagococcus]RHH71595.1 YihY/virulence factor BrkB family protein [Vagococcus sp. AM17-17]